MIQTSPLRGELKRDEAMARHVSWRAGGSVDRAYRPADLDDLAAFLRSLPAAEPVYFVGLGSNLLVRDGGLRGTVVFTHWAFREIELADLNETEGEIRADAGVASPKVARFAALHGLVGAEFLAGIPGTIGGALAMNAGCYGGETWNVVRRVVTIDRSGELHERTRAQYRIGYRTVVRRCSQIASVAAPDAIKRRAGVDEWFVSAVIALPRGDGDESRRKVKELLSRRIATQPLGEPNAGSVFRNPPGSYAAKLIEDCGLKGRAIGGAVISEKHANFIVNKGGARAADIEALIELAQSSVKTKFGIELEREVRIVGEAA
ncbi:MAG TPA: UDP-N-acetylmuramate dehydrogenase [Burkholderiales bacterium]|nr:UDP-N-acetylmuramate dehydrogenase [Burkholderiales bacterium]